MLARDYRELEVYRVAYAAAMRIFYLTREFPREEAYALTGQIRRFEDLAEDDWRRGSPRFQGQNFAKNLELVQRIEVMAREKGYTPSQLALAWVLGRGRDIVPIFGTKRRKYLLENLKALEIRLTPEDLRRLEELAPKGAVAGDRYPAPMMNYIGR